jgi:simple sugar transport system permease protein
MTLSLATNQVATGLADAARSRPFRHDRNSFVGLPGERLPNLDIPGLTSIPVVGRLLFGQDPISTSRSH